MDNMMWKYWKKVILEDMDEIREIIVDLKKDQARIQDEQYEIELRLNQIKTIMDNMEDDRGE